MKKGWHFQILVLGPNKKISVFQVAGLKTLGRVGTHIFEKYIILCILKGIPLMDL